jgi:predicted dehydrogenase
MKQSFNRRHFIQSGAAMTASLAMVNPWSRALGANEAIRVGVVGFRSRGKSHIQGFGNLPGVRLTALCDVDLEVLEKGVEQYSKPGQKLKAYSDYRRMLEDKDIDLISIATPNHTHALISVEAILAGKDVYVEKPVSHNLWEGQQIVNAARKHNKVVQTGTQCRSNPGMQEAVRFIQEGGLGAIRVARGLCYKRRKSIGKVEGPQAVPKHIDFDLWTGPAPLKPLMRENLHYDWHWVRDTGNGDLGNQGIHQMDIARWILGEDQLAPRVVSVGGRLGYEDDGDTANTQIVFHHYEKAPLIFEVRGLGSYAQNNARPNYLGVEVGLVIDCEEGYMVIPSYSSATAYSHSGKVIRKFSGGGDHFANMIQAVRSRKREDLNADIWEGHISSGLCHTGNISYYLGQKASPGEVMETIRGDALAAESVGRMLEHLQVNDVDLNATPVTLGLPLQMDASRTGFVDQPRANEMLTRVYRKPFEVPSVVV